MIDPGPGNDRPTAVGTRAPQSSVRAASRAGVPAHAASGRADLLAALEPSSRLLALALAPDVEDPDVAAALDGALGQGVDWKELGRLAAHERAARSLVALLETRADRVPDHSLARVRRLAQFGTVQSQFLTHRLRRLLGLLSSEGIPVMLLKGAALAHRFYPDAGMRPMGDLDLLVRAEDAQSAWLLAQRAGWQRRADVPDARHYIGHQHVAPLEDDQGAETGLEFHTELFTRQAPFALPASDLWARAERVPLLGEVAAVPDPADLLLHACLHFAWSHEMTFGVCRTLNDVRAIGERAPLDWEAFVTRARAARGATCCYWTLRLARELTGVAVPDEVLAALAPRLPRPVRDRLLHHFAAQAFSAGAQCPSVMLARTLWSLGIAPRGQKHGASRPWHDTAEWTRNSGDGGGGRAGLHGIEIARYAITLLVGG